MCVIVFDKKWEKKVFFCYCYIIQESFEKFEPQQEDGITYFYKSDTIVHVLQDTFENCNHFGHSLIV